jgi:GTP cyclohydrolase I
VEELKPREPGRASGSQPGRVDRTRAAAAITEFLRALGFEPARDPELADTARLVADAYADELLVGYRLDPAEILADCVSASSSDLVAVRDIRAVIVCPHHLMPAVGVVHVAYAPAGRVVGFGALARLVSCYARRLTLQESLAESIAAALCTQLGARGAGCVADLSPTCLTARAERCDVARALSVATAGEMAPGGPLHAAFVATLLRGAGAEVAL